MSPRDLKLVELIAIAVKSVEAADEWERIQSQIDDVVFGSSDSSKESA